MKPVNIFPNHLDHLKHVKLELDLSNCTAKYNMATGADTLKFAK